jgi:plasmid stabilization system protein ParE
MLHIRWSTTAFATLESLPQKTAFEILDRADKLASFPELGVSLRHLYSVLGNCRQLVFRRKYRPVYIYEEDEGEIRILMLQHCRQQLPTSADLHRAINEIKLADEEDTSG